MRGQNMNNKTMGNSFENEFAQILYDKGFWVHLLNQNNSGQPADVIAVKNKRAYLIDCKVCSNGKFALSRIEENQDLAMDSWAECGNGLGWFALKLNTDDDQIYMISHYVMNAYRARESSLSSKTIYELGTPLSKWVKMC
jgi:Holliday junction resolvase